jgi:choline dehydrogenase-like flavoprotein
MPDATGPGETAFDYIICGAGAAGCVVANRLSADPKVRVLLIEAGPSDRTWLTRMPRGFARLLLNQRRARYFQTGPDNGAKPGGEMWSRGRMLGGSSSINGMLYFHGLPQDYDHWEALGNTGWGWDTIVAVFRQMEDHALGSGVARGVGGPVKVTINPERSRLMDEVIAAGEAIGYAPVEDLNEPGPDRIGYTPFNIGKAQRSGAAQAFLHPVANRPNLTILTGTLVHRILFEGRRAVGVQAQGQEGVRTLRAGREVILAGGALQTPQLLELSGIGAAGRLRDHGIGVLHDSPGVGENLREHCLIIMQRRLLKPWSLNAQFSGWRAPLNVARWFALRSGPMAFPGFDAAALVACDPDATHPDAHLIFSRTSMDLRSWDGWTKGPQLERAHGMQLMGYPSQPRSQGSVHIRSADPTEAPEIKVNYLTDEHDRRVSIHMFRAMRRLIEHPSLAEVVGEETIPGPRVQTDDEIIDAFATYSGPGYHACGSARMGSDPMAVVDSRLRVHGVSGLRVVDISIFPTQTSQNTGAPAMAVAWHAADIINEDRLRAG